MKAAAFDYVRAGSIAEALGLLQRHGDGAKLVSGGQSLMPILNLRLIAPEILIDITGLDALKTMSLSGSVLRIGALTRHVELQNAPLIAQHAPLLKQAIQHVAHPAIRNRVTIGGNLAHADPASELPACMLALGATLVIAGAAGERRVAAEDFFLGTYETALQPHEILVAIEVPVQLPNVRTAFVELARRSGDYAIVGLAAHAMFSGEIVSDLKLGFFAVGDRPTLAKNAAACLIGKRPDELDLQAAQAALSGDLTPQSDQQATPEMRMHLARVLLGRVMDELCERSLQTPRKTA
jgi:aerobic carbon-monoxide dehydrogenase medium subunit